MSIKNSGRHAVFIDEGFEPGSKGEVLKNLLGIKTRQEIDIVEEQALKRAELALLSMFDSKHRFTAQDICNMHALWLGDIYAFAGKYRTINLWKDNFAFAYASRIAYQMLQFEQHCLAKYTPCESVKLDELAHELAVVCVELNLIHPFREGNARVSRLLTNLMAKQAGYQPINYSCIDQTCNLAGFNAYISAIHTGAQGNYYPMKEIFKKILVESIA